MTSAPDFKCLCNHTEYYQAHKDKATILDGN